MFEAAKGALVLVTGLGLLSFIHRDLHHAAEELVRHLHLNPANHFPSIFLDVAARADDGYLWLLSLAALLYATVRFVEAYGLWRRKLWATWFGVLSGSIYVPFEIFELFHRVSWATLAILLINAAVVAYLGYSLVKRRRGSAAGDGTQTYPTRS